MKTLLQINPVLRTNTSTGRIMQEIGELAMSNGWESHIAYSRGRDGVSKPCRSHRLPIGNVRSLCWHGVMTRLFDRHGLASKQATREFIKQIEAIKPAIIHIHNIHGYFLNYKLLFEYLATSGIPVIWTVHDCWLYTGHCYYYSYIGCDRWKLGCGACPQQTKFPVSWWMDRSRQNWIDKQAAFTSMPKEKLVIVPVSDWIREEMSHSFLKDYPFKVIHNGIDTNVFQPMNTQEVKDRYGLNGKKVILGVAGIWSKEKGLDDFKELSRLLAADEIILLVGVSPKLQTSLPKNIKGIQKTANIHQLAELYAAADVFVNPTWQDNYPTVNMEAIACGTPVVTYRTGGSIEAVTKTTGRIVPQGDIKGLLAAVRNILSEDKSHYRSLCRTYALEHFRKEDRYADYIDLYNQLSS